MQSVPQKRERVTSTLSGAIDKKSYSGKVDVFQDSKVYNVEKLPSDVPPLDQVVKQPLLVSKLTHQASYPLEKPRDPLILSSKGLGAHRAYEPVTARVAISSSSSATATSKVDQAYSEMEYLQTELEWFRLGGSAASGQTSSGGNTANGQTSSGNHRNVCLVV